MWTPGPLICGACEESQRSVWVSDGQSRDQEGPESRRWRGPGLAGEWVWKEGRGPWERVVLNQTFGQHGGACMCRTQGHARVEPRAGKGPRERRTWKLQRSSPRGQERPALDCTCAQASGAGRRRPGERWSPGRVSAVRGVRESPWENVCVHHGRRGRSAQMGRQGLPETVLFPK